MTMIQQKSDAELVGEYARTRSDPAFAAIVQRHVNAVYAAAWRQVRDAALAEDVTQAVFIVLAKRAHRIHDPRLLAGWLLKVTRYCAADARKLAARREFHEQRAAGMKPTMSEGNVMEPDIAEHLDAHLAALGAVDRAAIVLRCLEERPLAEVARELRMSEEAAKKRVARALEKLRKRFTRNGATLSGAILTAALAKQTFAAPPALAATICTAAAAKTASGTTAVLLAKGALKIMAWSSAKVAAITVVGTIVIAGTTAGIVHVAVAPDVRAQDAPPAASAEPSSAPAASREFLYVMGKVNRPGVYALEPGMTPRQVLRAVQISASLQRDGWVRFIRRVGPNLEHSMVLRIADLAGGVQVPAAARGFQPNDVLEIGVPAPDPAPQLFDIGSFSILGNVQHPGSYEVFGKLITTMDAVSRIAKTQQPVDQLIVSIVRPNAEKVNEVVAQVKLADVQAGRTDDQYLAPGDIVIVQLVSEGHMPPPATRPHGLAIVAADNPSMPGDKAKYVIQGPVMRPGVFLIDGQEITVKMALAAAAADISEAKGITATLVRRVDADHEKRIEVHLQAIFDGTEADRFLQGGDVITVHAGK